MPVRAPRFPRRIGAACEMTGTSSFKALWGATLGVESAWLVDLSVALMCLSALIIYTGILVRALPLLPPLHHGVPSPCYLP